MLRILSEELKRNIRESLVYALTQLRNERDIGLVLRKFYNSLNRKNLLLNCEVENEIAEAWKSIKDQAI